MTRRTAEQVQSDVGRRIAELRVARGWTQQQLAEHYRGSHSYIQAVERGAENLRIDTLVRFAEVLGVNVAKLFFRPNLERKVGRPTKKSVALPFQELEPQPADLYKRCVPLMTLEARAGSLGEALAVETASWVVPNTRTRLGPGMFVAKITGDSMEPDIPSGSFCLFRASHQTPPSGTVVLAQHREADDPEEAGAYLLKRVVVSKGKARLESRKRGIPPVDLATDTGEWSLVAILVERLAPAG